MAKSKDKSEVEHLRGNNRNLKAEIRHLKRELGRKDKQIKVYDQFVGDPDPEPEEQQFFVNKDNCPKCGKPLEIADLIIKDLHICHTPKCGYRKTVAKKPNGKNV